MYIKNKNNYVTNMLRLFFEWNARIYLKTKVASVEIENVEEKRKLDAIAIFRASIKPNSIRATDLIVKNKKDTASFLIKLKRYQEKRQKETSRYQFDTVAIIRMFINQGFGLVDVINYAYGNILSRKDKPFQVLLRQDNWFVLIEDDFAESGIGSTCKVYIEYWPDKYLQDNGTTKNSFIELIRLSHRSSEDNRYLKKMDRAVRYFRQIMDFSLRYQGRKYLANTFGKKIKIPKTFK